MNLSLSRTLTRLLVLSSFAFALPVSAAPIIGMVSPTNPNANVSVNLQANVTGGSTIQSCNLYVESEDLGAMTVSNGTASRAYTFTRGGVHTAFVFCRDVNGGIASGPNTSIFVQGQIVNTPPISNQTPATPPSNPVACTMDAKICSDGSAVGRVAPNCEFAACPNTPPAATSTNNLTANTLVKLACPANAAVDHPCKAVYYIGADGFRHAFPNSRVYFTWYPNFDNVQEVSSTALGSVMLGKNVTYRPGVRMVKFTTDPKVYAVGRGGKLSWITSEQVAIQIFGNDWNSKIDDIPDSFYANYTFGTDINTSTDFNSTSETLKAPTINENW